MTFKRTMQHLVHFPWRVHNAFPSSAMRAIESAILDAERGHAGELRFAVEGALDLPELIHGMTARERALAIFSNLRIWDTEHNNGVLIYLLLADRDVEIIADRGINQRIPAGEWEKICRAMESLLRQGQYETAVLQGVARVGELLQQHYPAIGPKRNELDNRPVVVKR